MSVALNRDIVATHKNDPQWIISLWLAIHGGDPGPDGIISAREAQAVAANAIRQLSGYLDAGKQKAVTAALG